MSRSAGAIGVSAVENRGEQVSVGGGSRGLVLRTRADPPGPHR